MPMKNPPHPGGFVFRQYIESLGLGSAAICQDEREVVMSEVLGSAY